MDKNWSPKKVQWKIIQPVCYDRKKENGLPQNPTNPKRVVGASDQSPKDFTTP